MQRYSLIIESVYCRFELKKSVKQGIVFLLWLVRKCAMMWMFYLTLLMHDKVEMFPTLIQTCSTSFGQLCFYPCMFDPFFFKLDCHACLFRFQWFYWCSFDWLPRWTVLTTSLSSKFTFWLFFCVCLFIYMWNDIDTVYFLSGWIITYYQNPTTKRKTNKIKNHAG